MNKEEKTDFIEPVARYTLIALLVVVSLDSVFVSAINPEAYFFGEKLVRTKAVFYLSSTGIIGIMIAYFLLDRKDMGEILSVLYFGYFFIETLMTNVISGFGFLISPLNAVGLAISIVLLTREELSSEKLLKSPLKGE